MASYTTGQAGGQVQPLTNIPAEYTADALELARAQRMAQMLSSAPMAEGQMVSGRYVAPSWTQSLAQLANATAGAYFGNQAEEKQLKLAEKLRQDKLMTQQGIMDAIDKGDTKKALAIASSRPEYSKEFIAPLMANVIPKAPTPPAPTTEMQNFQFAKERGEIPKGMTFLGYQTYMKQVGKEATEKAPMGYRFLPDGSLEPIKGGPADMKTQAKVAGAGDVSTEIIKLKDSYDKLFKGGGITDPSLSGYKNIVAKASTTPLGQGFASTFGTQNATERDKISQSRPLLMGAIMRATGMSAKAIDSNAELKLWLATATDPTKSYEANIEALQNIENLYGVTALERQAVAPTFNPNKPNAQNAPSAPNTPSAPNAQSAKTVVKTGTVQDGPNKGKKAVQYSDGTVEIK
jgi:hypothetical protein